MQSSPLTVAHCENGQNRSDELARRLRRLAARQSERAQAAWLNADALRFKVTKKAKKDRAAYEAEWTRCSESFSRLQARAYEVRLAAYKWGRAKARIGVYSKTHGWSDRSLAVAL